jgi:hypothetical protein
LEEPPFAVFMWRSIEDGSRRVRGAGILLNQRRDAGGRIGIPNRWRQRGGLAISLLALIGCMLVYFGMVFDAPTRTPMLLVSSTYDPPWDINPWESENVAALERLHRHNLTVKKLHDPNPLAKGQWSDFEDAIANLDHVAERGQPLLVYLNLHGVVGGDAQPYLVVQDSIPLDSGTWIPLQSVLDHIANGTRGDRRIILFLESGRQTGVLPKEQPDHVFAAAVRKVFEANVDQTRFRNLSIFVSTTTNAGSTNAADGQSDPFTHSLSQGLGGLCDQKKYGGNGNRHVELDELDSYIQRWTKEFALANRGFLQSSVLFTRERTPLRIAWAGSPAQDVLKGDLSEPTPQMETRLNEAWKSIGLLRPKAPWHDQPAEWARLVGTAVAMEEAAFGGKAAVERFDDFSETFSKLLKQLESPSSLSAQTPRGADLDLDLARSSQMLWQKVSEHPDYEFVAKAIQPNTSLDGLTFVCPVPFLSEAAKFPSLGMWQDTETLSQLAKLQSRLDAARLQMANLPAFRALESYVRLVDGLRRKLEDRLLASSLNAQKHEEIARDLRAFDKAVLELVGKTECYRQALCNHELALSELPRLHRALDSIEAISVHATQEGPSALDPLVDKILDNFKRLRRCLDSDTADVQAAPDIQNDIVQLHQRIALQWSDMMSRPASLSPAHNYALQELLRSGFLPCESTSLDKGIELRLATRKYLSQSGIASAQQQKSSTGTTSDIPHSNQRLMANLILAFSQRDPTSDSAQAVSSFTCLHDLGNQICKSMGSDINATDSNRFSAMSIARAMAPLCLDPDSSRLTRDWNASATRTRWIRSANRIADDFWKTPTCKSVPYFYYLASQLLDLASSDPSEPNQDLLETAFHDLEAKLASSDGAIELTAEHCPDWQCDKDNVMKCDISLGTHASGLPNGIAAIEIERREDATTHKGPPTTIQIGPDMNAQSISITGPEQSTSPATKLSEFTAVLRFRGHRFQSRFQMIPSQNNVSVAMLASRQPASVQVIDSRVKRRARTLILDCSASMIGPYGSENQEPNTQNSIAGSKMSAARLAINEIMSRWTGTPDLVAVHFFGHRIAQGTLEQGTLIQNRYVTTYPTNQTLRAFEDAEIALPLGRFSDAEYSLVRQRLELLLPWGQTPLYLAIQQAIEEGTRLANGMPHDIIVISDGRNYQFNPTPDKNVTIESVIQLAKASGTRIHIVGFGVPENEIEEASEQYQRLAAETGGSVAQQVSDAIDLVEKIDRIVKPETFVVELATGERWTQECSQALPLPASLRTNTPVWVQYRDQRMLVPVSPGSRVRLLVSGQERLVATSEVPGREVANVPILNSHERPSPFQLGVFAPKRVDGGLRWHLALRRNDGLVPQRPAYVWVEIQPERGATTTPMSPSDAFDGAYRIADACWQPDMPVPVLSFDTRNWPIEAEMAKLQYWCTDVKPDVLATIPVATDDAFTSHSTTQSLPSLGLRYQIQRDKAQLLLVLMHEQPEDVPSVMPQAIGCEMVRVEREYSKSRRMSVHRFQWLPDTTPPTALELLDCKDIQQKGLQLVNAVDLLIAPEVSALPNSPAPQLRR